MPEQNDLVRTEIVVADQLASYLANLHGREKHEYLPYAWLKDHELVSGCTFRVTHYMVISWKCRG